MTQILYLTGTDTACGKTTATAALARALADRGERVACFKPVAAGCEVADGGLRNDDALVLQRTANVPLDYDLVNPYALEPPIAPHIAAARAGVKFDFEAVARQIHAVEADWKLVEGAGGWMVPMDEKRMQADLARAITDRVVLVVGMRLGCLNHTLLTVRAIAADGFKLAGWIANFLDPVMAEQAANLETLRRRIDAPLLGRLPALEDGTSLRDFAAPEAISFRADDRA